MSIKIDLNKLNALHQKLRTEDELTMQAYSSDRPMSPSPSHLVAASELFEPQSNKDQFLLQVLKENKIDPQKLIQLLQIMSMFSQNDTVQFIKALDLNVSIEEFEKLKESLEKLKDLHEIELEIAARQRRQGSPASAAQEVYDGSSLYRLPILKSSLVVRDRDSLIVDVVKEKFTGINLVRQMEHDAHKIISKAKGQKLACKDMAPFVTNDQRFFQKNYGNMSLGCLNAVDKAYGDRRVIDRRLSKLKVV